ncbi:MAG TPA: acyl-[acyl-carrier-protein]--UDP-N-acetylglucosamine O-acyltransferase, partial [Caldimonas sp.]|nr:acyl-[acyl-carrier-protein]--UDP-N-acetylglucosamine O-acyltransferase [Caldimonas sp.]
GLAGHVHLGDWAIVGAQSGLHQFVQMGAHSMCGFQSHVSQDVPPYMMVDGNPLSVRGFNAEGLRRRGYSTARIAAVRQMHRLLYREGLPLDKARDEIAALAASEPEAAGDIASMSAFLARAKRGIAR